MIKDVLRFQNGEVMVFDERGEQLPEYQGRYDEVKEKILADAPASAQFFRGGWNLASDVVPREKW